MILRCSPSINFSINNPGTLYVPDSLKENTRFMGAFIFGQFSHSVAILSGDKGPKSSPGTTPLQGQTSGQLLQMEVWRLALSVPWLPLRHGRRQVEKLTVWLPVVLFWPHIPEADSGAPAPASQGDKSGSSAHTVPPGHQGGGPALAPALPGCALRSRPGLQSQVWLVIAAWVSLLWVPCAWGCLFACRRQD